MSHTEPLPDHSGSVQMMTVPESVPVLKRIIDEQHPNITPFRTALVIEMPCCGFSFDAEAIDCVPGEWSKVYDPIQWTCPCCERIYTMGYLGLEEVNPAASDERRQS